MDSRTNVCFNLNSSKTNTTFLEHQATFNSGMHTLGICSRACFIKTAVYVWDLSWAPRDYSSASRLGFLAACFGDGKARIYDISTSPDYFTDAPIIFESKIPDTLLWRASCSPDCTKVA
jgi:hypothetical protein